jgi:branched-chain amino acid transport system substrate-binding protein
MSSILKRIAAHVVVIGACAVAAHPALAQQTIKLGSVLSATGPGALLGDAELKTLQLYVDHTNANSPVNGKKIEFIVYDDASDANKANQFTKRLIEDDKVDLIIGGSTTGSTMAMIPLVEKAGVPFISLAGAVTIVDPVRKWVFKTAQTDRQAVERVFEDMKRRGISRIGVLTETSGYGQSGRKEILAAAPKFGITLLSDETYGVKDSDITAQLTKIKGGSGIQALYIFGLGQGPAIATKNAAQLQIKLPIYHSHGVASREFIKLAGPASEGSLMPSAALLAPDQLAANDPQRAPVQDFRKLFRGKYPNDELSLYAGFAHDAFMVATNAIRKVGSTDKAKVRQAIEDTKNHVGVIGTFNLSATDHMGLDTSSLRMFEVKNQDFVLVK